MGAGMARPGAKPDTEARRHERTLQAVELRKQGLSYREVADKLGVHHSTAYEDVWRHFGELERLSKEELDQVRRLELARLDGYLRALAPACEEGDTKAILAACRVGERRAKLMGLDAPTKHEVTTPEKMSDDELRARLRAAVAEADKAEREKVH